MKIIVLIESAGEKLSVGLDPGEPADRDEAMLAWPFHTAFEAVMDYLREKLASEGDFDMRHVEASKGAFKDWITKKCREKEGPRR